MNVLLIGSGGREHAIAWACEQHGHTVTIAPELGDATADDVDLVLPYRAFLAGELDTATAMVRAVAAEVAAPRILKVILESGAYGDGDEVRAAAALAIEALRVLGTPEADAVITHPEYGLLVLEVKAGEPSVDPDVTARWLDRETGMTVAMDTTDDFDMTMEIAMPGMPADATFGVR